MSINPLVPPRILGFTLIIFSATLFNSCGSTANADLSRLDPIIEMSKGPCYGRCPVFTLTVYENGIASYEGERYTDRLGTYVKKLEKGQMERLLGEFKRANVWQFRDSYRGRIPDMQSVTITYREDNKKKTITGKEIRPNAVKWLETQLDQVAQSEGWILKEAPQDNVPDYLIPDQLLVELEGGSDPEEWAKKFAQADMLFERPLNDSGFWIFSYNDELITPDQMLEQVRMDKEVISAEFNKRIYNEMNKEEDEEKDTGSKAPKDTGDKPAAKQSNGPGE
ncbi:MAG: hypothetical protein GVY26_11215 [Bacteroidetes bacterium]|nr:hypothetical protein [Bacteroidota bacterium]